MMRKKSCNCGKFRQFLATACLGSISFGASCSWTSPVLPYFQDLNSDAPFHLDVEEVSWVESTLSIGAFLSAVPAGYIVERFGRKKTIIGLVVPVIIFTVLVMCAKNFETLCVARFFSGIATGSISVVGAMYISEIADVSLRGTLGSLFEMLIYVGMALTAILGAYMHYTNLTLLVGLQSLIFGVIFLVIPESPVYLMKIGRKRDAEKAISFFRSNDYDIAKEIHDIREELHQKREAKTFCELFTDKRILKGLIACVGLTIFQQLSAVDAVIFNLVDIFRIADGFIDEYTSSVIITPLQLIPTILFVFIVEKLPRKTLLYISSIGLSLNLYILGVYFHLKEKSISIPGLSLLPLATIICYFFFFSLGMGPIPWLINGELFSSDVKGPANGITIATNWILLFIVTKTFPIMIANWAHYTFYFYAICMALSVLFIKYCVPETRGKSLHEIQLEMKSVSADYT